MYKVFTYRKDGVLLKVGKCVECPEWEVSVRADYPHATQQVCRAMLDHNEELMHGPVSTFFKYVGRTNQLVSWDSMNLT